VLEKRPPGGKKSWKKEGSTSAQLRPKPASRRAGVQRGFNHKKAVTRGGSRGQSKGEIPKWVGSLVGKATRRNRSGGIGVDHRTRAATGYPKKGWPVEGKYNRGNGPTGRGTGRAQSLAKYNQKNRQESSTLGTSSSPKRVTP